MNPSKGIIDPTWVKALVIDDGRTPVAFVTLDMIGSSGRYTPARLDRDCALIVGRQYAH
jgi:hypothetical protein